MTPGYDVRSGADFRCFAEWVRILVKTKARRKEDANKTAG